MKGMHILVAEEGVVLSNCGIFVLFFPETYCVNIIGAWPRTRRKCCSVTSRCAVAIIFHRYAGARRMRQGGLALPPQHQRQPQPLALPRQPPTTITTMTTTTMTTATTTVGAAWTKGRKKKRWTPRAQSAPTGR